MTPQNAFDTVTRHLLRFRFRMAVEPQGNIVYRTKGGNTCAIGCLIPAWEYTEAMEGFAVKDLDTPCLRGLDRDLLQQLQTIHDCAMEGHEMYNRPARAKRLREIAKRFSLSSAAVDEMTKGKP